MANIQTPNLDIDYLNAQNPTALIEVLKQMPSQQFLFNQPQQTQLTDNQMAEQIGAGLNLGSPQIAAWQKANNVLIPQTEEEKYNASLGIKPNAGLTGNVDTKPTFFDNVLIGYKDNYSNGFNPSNFKNTDKPISQRLGEGLGTAMRFIDSPLGRGLLAGGLNSMLGYNNSLQEGLTAMSGRQNAVTADKLYRNSLKDMGYTDEQLGQITGNINAETYRQILAGKQLKDNADYRNLYLQNQQNMQKALQDYRKDQLEFNKQKLLADAEDKKIQRALQQMGINATIRGQNMTFATAQDKLKFDMLKEQNKQGKTNNDLAEIEQQLKNFENMFDKVPNKLRGSTTGALRRTVGLASTNEANFDAQRTLLFNQIARKLGGDKGVLSDQDIKRIEKALPALSDSYAQRKAKMQAIYDLLDIKKGSSPKADPLGIR